MRKQIQFLCGAAASLLTALVIGCTPQAAPPNAPPPATPSAGGEHAGHSHGDAPHGGTLIDWGGGRYHVEFTVDHEAQEATVYLLGEDARTPLPIKAKDGKILLTIVDPEFQVELTAVPSAEDPEGTSSKFTGKHENLGKVQEFAGSISGEVDGTPYAGDFKEEAHDHDHGHEGHEHDKK